MADEGLQQACQEWGAVLCEWGEELKVAAEAAEESENLLPPDRKEFFAIVFQQVRHEDYIEGFQEGQAKGREQSKATIAKLRAEVEKLKAAGTKDAQKQEALEL